MKQAYFKFFVSFYRYVTEGMEEEIFVEARENLAALEMDYREAGSDSSNTEDTSVVPEAQEV